MIERHFSAFKGELKKYFGFKPGYLFLDLTLGDGGHTQEALTAGCRVISFDVDPEAVKRAISFIKNYSPLIIDPESYQGEIPSDFSWVIIKSNFVSVSSLAEKFHFPKFSGIMADLGPSQFQVLSPGRGFSFTSDEPLDMRLDKNLSVSAADLLAVLNEGELTELFSLADEPYAKPIAKFIVKHRQATPLKTTKQLANIVSRVKKVRPGSKTHPATQVFMALRMAVNLERENIRQTLPQLPALLQKDGFIGIISFHSGEDRLVKDFVRQMEDQKILSAINKKPLKPSLNELKISQRTRSAKLRLAKKIN